MNLMNLELPLSYGDELKDQGIERVLSNNQDWRERTLEEIVYISHKMDKFTSDDVRKACCNLTPKNGNAWGAIMNAAAKKGLIKKTGSYVKSKIPSNHGHLNAEWTRV